MSLMLLYEKKVDIKKICELNPIIISENISLSVVKAQEISLLIEDIEWKYWRCRFIQKKLEMAGAGYWRISKIHPSIHTQLYILINNNAERS